MSKVNQVFGFLEKHKVIAISLGAVIVGFVGYKIATNIYKKNNDILIAKEQSQINPNG